VITEELVLTMPGRPAPKGSMKCVGRNGMHQLVEDNKNTAKWRKQLVAFLKPRFTTSAADYQPIGIEVTFTLDRPGFHYGTGRNEGVVKPSAPTYPTKKPTGELCGGDVDKLARLVLDALQDARVLPDDAQVVELTARKAYEKSSLVPDALQFPGVRIRIYPYEGI